MSHGSDAADMMVKESIQISEQAVKLAALGAKNLAAMIIALSKDNQKIAGKTNLNRMLREGKELKVFPVRAADLAAFVLEARRYGVLYTVIRDKSDPTGNVDIVARAEDVSKINHILDRMDYAAPEREQSPKKDDPRAPSVPKSNARGSGLDAQQTMTFERMTHLGRDPNKLIAKQSAPVTRQADELTALGAPRLAELLLAMTKGRSALSRMIYEGETPQIIPMRGNDLSLFSLLMKHEGMPFSVIHSGQNVDAVVRAQDANKVGDILKRMHYIAPEATREAVPESPQPRRKRSKQRTRAQKITPARESSVAAPQSMIPQGIGGKPSVKGRIDAIKQMQAGLAGKTEKNKAAQPRSR